MALYSGIEFYNMNILELFLSIGFHGFGVLVQITAYIFHFIFHLYIRSLYVLSRNLFYIILLAPVDKIYLRSIYNWSTSTVFQWGTFSSPKNRPHFQIYKSSWHEHKFGQGTRGGAWLFWRGPAAIYC
jgi:hypothetical protein